MPSICVLPHDNFLFVPIKEKPIHFQIAGLLSVVPWEWPLWILSLFILPHSGPKSHVFLPFAQAARHSVTRLSGMSGVPGWCGFIYKDRGWPAWRNLKGQTVMSSWVKTGSFISTKCIIIHLRYTCWQNNSRIWSYCFFKYIFQKDVCSCREKIPTFFCCCHFIDWSSRFEVEFIQAVMCVALQINIWSCYQLK